MVIRYRKSCIRASDNLKIPEPLSSELTVGHIYDFCCDLWSVDFKNIAHVSIDSIYIKHMPARKTWNESDLHAILKHSAANWLKNRGHKNVEFEKGYECGIADVICRDSKVVVECGNINDDSILSPVSIGWTVICIPYHFFNAEEYESTYPMLIFHKDRGRKLDSIFKRMAEKEIERHRKKLVKGIPKGTALYYLTLGTAP